jgi:hypothetical protein
MPRFRLAAAPLFILIILIATPAAFVAAQQSDYSVAPFESCLAASGKTPLAGLDLTVSGNPGLALRLSGRVALRKTYEGGFTTGSMIPPWGADVDMVAPLSGRPFGPNRSIATFGFLGLGAAATDSATSRSVRKNWSYGLGTSIPLGSVVEIFADSRWRIAKFVLPTAHPTREKEVRFGMTFHFGGGTGRRY